MLEERWREIAATHAREVALHDAATGHSWTFAELAAAADAELSAATRQLAFPTGHGIGFILSVLRAWHAGSVVCPLEPGQPPPAIPLPPAGLVHLKLTSGTTGAAKCVAFTASQLAADADAIVATMGLRPDWPNLGVISLAHSYGFSNLILPLLLHGIPLVLVPSPLPAVVLSASHALGDTPLTLAAVPALWRTWHDAAAIPSRVRLAISAGAPLPLGVEAEVFATRGLKLHNFLGASECGGIAYDMSHAPRREAQFVGQPLRGVKPERDDAGCLEVRGPAVGERYWPDSSECLRDGCFRTGDRVDFDADGGVFLRGRASDVINVAGRKVAPESIELALRQHSDVRECLVLGLPGDEQRGEVVVAVIEAEPSLTTEALRDFALARLPAWQVPRRWHWVSALAPDGRGKLSRAEWRSRLLARI